MASESDSGCAGPMPAEGQAADGGGNGKGEEKFRCGTLFYSKRGLIMLFVWLLWGDFCFTLMEIVVPNILPLKLKALGSPNWLISLLLTVLPNIFNVSICPWVSFKSDRHRSRWGRRLPFILYTMPFLTASLVFIGMSDSIGSWLHAWFLQGSALTKSMTIVIVLGLFAGMFDLFNMFVGSVYWYLFNDVVPTPFLPRFMAWFRMVGIGSTALYQWFVFQYALSHMRAIYFGAAALYLVGFGIMCLKVKEGEYPPPSDEGQAPSLAADIKTFARECYSISYYWNIFLCHAFLIMASTIMVFNVFFQQTMGLNLKLIGRMSSVSLALTTFCLAFMGFLVERWHPVRVDAYLTAYLAFSTFFNMVWLFAAAPHGDVYFWAMIGNALCTVVVTAALAASSLPRLMVLFPRERYGAFCGAQAALRSAMLLILGMGAGLFIDVVSRYYRAGDYFPYRFIWIWVAIFTALAAVFNYRGYRYWKRMGGETGYRPPSEKFRFSDLPKAADSRVRRSLLIPPMLGFAGLLVLCMAFAGYFHYVSYDDHSTKVFGVFAILTVLFALCYVRYIKFLERP